MDKDSDEIVIADELNEPQVTSKDPNERKLARRLRIEKRWNIIRRLTMPGEELPEEIKRDPVQYQIQKSAVLLQKYVKQAEEHITNIRVASDAREVDRREMEGIGREKVMEQLDAEATAATEMFHDIAQKWSSIQKYPDPLHIREEIANQTEKCDQLINQKDEIIAMLKHELKLTNKRFDKDQHKQIGDINTLTQRIEKQLTFMRKSYQMERQLIEDVMMMERHRIIEDNNKKWDDLYRKREQEENVIAERKMHRLEEFNEKMTEIRINYQERFRETKIKIEREIEFMQRELERIKALVLVNSEKLDYNYQILKTREDENLIIKSQNKRRMNKLQDVINAIKQKISDYKSSTEDRIKKLTIGIQKLHRSIIDIEAKADRFATINDEKFHKVWDINTAIVKRLMRRIVATDKILYDQQMGIKWQQPHQSAIIKTQLPSYRNAMMKLHPSTYTLDKRTSIASSTSKMSIFSSHRQNSSLLKEFDSTPADKPAVDLSAPPTECSTNPYYLRLVKHLLKLVSDKSGFLTEIQLKKLLKGYKDDQQTIVRLDNVFDSLKISNKKYIDLLIDYFIPYAYCPVCSGNSPVEAVKKFGSGMSILSAVFPGIEQEEPMDIVDVDKVYYAVQQPGDKIDEIVIDLVTSETFIEERQIPREDAIDEICGDGMLNQFLDTQYYTEVNEKTGVTVKRLINADERLLCKFNHPLLINSVYVLMALRQFVEGYYKARKALPTTRERLEHQRLTISRLMTDNDIELYWEKYRLIYDEDRVKVWDALLEGLTYYHEILKKRRNLCEQVVSLRRQNEELKRLLANYIDHKRFMPPPCFDQGNCLVASVAPYTNAK